MSSSEKKGETSKSDALPAGHQYHQHIVNPVPSESFIDWMGDQNDDDLFIASLTIAEINRWILEKPAGKHRDQLDAWFSGPEGPHVLFAGRILPFDENAALIVTRLMAHGKSQDRQRSALDTIIASIAEYNGCTGGADNETEFEGIKFINPLRL